jgi:coproporphyrinogen III oxidase
MPPLVSWSYQNVPQAGSPEAELYSKFLVRREWV